MALVVRTLTSVPLLWSEFDSGPVSYNEYVG